MVPILSPCKRSNPRQKWYFGDYSPYGVGEANKEREGYGYADLEELQADGAAVQAEE